MLKKLWTVTISNFTQPVRLFRTYERSNFKADLIGGLTVAIVLLPQAIVFAMVAELPPQVGLYTAIVTAIIGALWGSSNHLQTGPTNSTSLLVLAILLPLAEVGSDQFLRVAGVLAVMVGVFQIVMGVARMGLVVNFVSDSVVIGFTAGAGVLISVNQFRHLMRLNVPSSSSLIVTIQSLIAHVQELHWISFLFGLAVIFFVALLKRIKPRWPGPLLATVISAAISGLLHLDQIGVIVIGQLPRSLPPLANLPLFDLDLISQLSTGALAVGAIGLVESAAISRSIAAQSGQHPDSNQEFIGQGMANLFSGFFSGYSVSGSFTRSAINYDSGSRTRLSSIFSGLFVMIAMLLITRLASFVPRTALAAVLVVTAYGMIDRKEIARIWRGAQGDAAIMVFTFLATLFLPLQFAVLSGILVSFAVYIMRTSVPRVVPVLPADDFSHFAEIHDTYPCSQLAILDIFGDLYFGASSHIDEAIRIHQEAHPSQRFLLLRMFSVDLIDISGVHALESIVRSLRQRGGDVFMMRTQEPVLNIFKSTGFYDYLGDDHFLSYGDAIGYIFNRVLDPTICIYECEARVFRECQNLPRPAKHPAERTRPVEMPRGKVASIKASELWLELQERTPPVVIDIREPREYKQGHIPQAESIPIFTLLTDSSRIHQIRQVVLVCRSGRRSSRAIHMLAKKGFTNLRILDGGMLAWENTGLLEALDF